MTALITPFADGEVDESAFRRLVEWQIAEGSHGLVPVGTTGESPTLTHAEHKRVIAIAVETAAGRVPVVAGSGSNNTVHAIEFTAYAKEVGAQAALVVTPYYNKPDQEGLYTHFMAVADAVELPMFIYNIPARSVVDMSPETMGRLAKHPNIIGVKDATGDLARVSRQRATCGPDFIQLSGEDATALGFNAHGGRGCISVTANVAPRLCAEFQNHTLAGRYEEARALQDRLLALHLALFASPSPGPIKYALSRLMGVSGAVRLPVTPPGAEARARINAALASAGLEGAP